MSSTGIFQMRRAPDDDDVTAAYAHIAVDALGTVVVTIVDWSPEGFGRNTNAWQGGTWLRYESVLGEVQLVCDWALEGDYSIERRWPADGDAVLALTESIEDEDADTALGVVARMVPEMAIEPLTADTLARLREETLPQSELDAVIEEMPEWETGEPEDA